MTARVNPFLTNGHLVKPLIDFAHGTHEGLDVTLVELINTRASQINGCTAASSSTRARRASRARPKSGSTSSTPGGRPPATPIASGPPSPGPRRSRVTNPDKLRHIDSEVAAGG